MAKAFNFYAFVCVCVCVSFIAHSGQAAEEDDETCDDGCVQDAHVEWLQRSIGMKEGAGQDRVGSHSASTLKRPPMSASPTPATPPKIHTLFVKFHKTASSTIHAYLRKFDDSVKSDACNDECGCTNWASMKNSFDRSCEIPQVAPNAWSTCLPEEVQHACFGHASMEVVRLGLATQNITPAIPKDLSHPSNLLPDRQRYSGLLSHAPFTQQWLPQPQQWSHELGIRIVTIMRDPAEKLRSQYYYDVHDHGHLPDASLRHSGFIRMLKGQMLHWPGNLINHWGVNYDYVKQRDCCEYLKYLGNWSLDGAKLVLATQFDLVGITERFDETLLSLARMYGYSTAKLAKTAVSVNEGGDKLDWTPEEYSMAKQVTAPDAEIYSFAQDLFQRQLLNMWDSQENLDAAVREYQALSISA